MNKKILTCIITLDSIKTLLLDLNINNNDIIDELPINIFKNNDLTQQIDKLNETLENKTENKETLENNV